MDDRAARLACRLGLIVGIAAATWLARCSAPRRDLPTSLAPAVPVDFDPGDFDPETFRPYASE
jgi:hypothetical protein